MNSFVFVALFGIIAVASAHPGFFNRGDVENKWEFGFETKTIPGRPIQLKIERGALPKEGEDKGTLNAIYTKHVERRNKLLSKLGFKLPEQAAEEPKPAEPKPEEANQPAKEPVNEEPAPQADSPAEPDTRAILRQRQAERVDRLVKKVRNLAGN